MRLRLLLAALFLVVGISAIALEPHHKRGGVTTKKHTTKEKTTHVKTTPKKTTTAKKTTTKKVTTPKKTTTKCTTTTKKVTTTPVITTPATTTPSTTPATTPVTTPPAPVCVTDGNACVVGASLCCNKCDVGTCRTCGTSYEVCNSSADCCTGFYCGDGGTVGNCLPIPGRRWLGDMMV